MIIENISWDSEPRYNMVEYKEFCSPTIIFNGRHGLYPFSKLIHNHDNMLVPPSRGWVKIHKIYPPLGEGNDGDDWVKRGWVNT
jgi:hypothetical protein